MLILAAGDIVIPPSLHIYVMESSLMTLRVLKVYLEPLQLLDFWYNIDRDIYRKESDFIFEE